MNKNTVKRRIFISNTLMILVTLGIGWIIGMGIPVINAVRGLGNMNLAAAFIGLGLVLGMHFIKEWSENYEH